MARATTTSRSKGSTTRGAAATASKSRARQVAEEASEYAEVTGGGDFPATWNFEDQGDLEGIFLGTVEKEIKGKTRTIHSFEVDGEEVTVWGTAILDSRLENLDADEAPQVKVVKTGAKVATRSGHQAWEFKVFVRRSALSKG